VIKPTLSDDISTALVVGRPIVALESTVIAHGLPRPQNLETARGMERTVRENGAVPATIAILNGELRVGLTENQLEYLATGKNIRKVSRRDLAIATAKQLDGATTVASTSFIANLAGIKVFATGGIGGVHRADRSDISADLPELAKTPIVVVCSGAKSVLDLPATREWLETHGITVLGWQCDEFPAFYSRSSGLDVDERVETAKEVAEIAFQRDEIGSKAALLVCVPVPEEKEIPSEELEKSLKNSLKLAGERKISGKAVTPFLLAQLSEQTAGRTLEANIALLENNARVAAIIAAEIATY
jgi:pseudouridine-5'-phosphate glycosidase